VGANGRRVACLLMVPEIDENKNHSELEVVDVLIFCVSMYVLFQSVMIGLCSDAETKPQTDTQTEHLQTYVSLCVSLFQLVFGFMINYVCVCVCV
jgi:magnesium-transporting ATPase (P-type)